MSKRWKAYERRVARFFGTERTPLSGGNSRHTGSDSLHPRLYIEAKSASGKTGKNRWVWTWLESLGWARGLIRIGKDVDEGALYVAHSSYVDDPFDECGLTKKAPFQCLDLWVKTSKGAKEERKTPLLALFCKGFHGWWFVGRSNGLLAAVNERIDVKAENRNGTKDVE